MRILSIIWKLFCVILSKYNFCVVYHGLLYLKKSYVDQAQGFFNYFAYVIINNPSKDNIDTLIKHMHNSAVRGKIFSALRGRIALNTRKHYCLDIERQNSPQRLSVANSTLPRTLMPANLHSLVNDMQKLTSFYWSRWTFMCSLFPRSRVTAIWYPEKKIGKSCSEFLFLKPLLMN